MHIGSKDYGKGFQKSTSGSPAAGREVVGAQDFGLGTFICSIE